MLVIKKPKEETKVICKKCGTQLPDIAHFCFNCGIAVDEVTDTNDNNLNESTNDKDLKDGVKADNENINDSDSNDAKEKVLQEDSKDSDTLDDDITDSKEDEQKTKLDNEEASEDDTDANQTDSEKEEENSGYSIMVNPDYVPPKIEEEVHLFEEHINYQEMYRKRTEKIEKVLTRVGTVVGVIVLVAVVGIVGAKIYFTHELNTAIEQGDSYYANKNYDEAIVKFNEALNARVADATDKKEVALKVMAAYEDQGNYEGARDAVLSVYNDIAKDDEDGARELYTQYLRLDELALGKSGDESSDKSDDTKSEDDGSQNNEAYDTVIKEAQSLMARADFDGAISKCEEAIAMDASNDVAYITAAKAYASKFDYDNAVMMCNRGVDAINEAGLPQSSELSDALDQYKEIVDKLAQYGDTCNKIYTSLDEWFTSGMQDNAINTLLTEDYDKVCATADTTYYRKNAGFVNSIANGKGMAVYSTKYAYIGDWKNGKRQGNGMLVTVQKDDNGSITYYVYKGEWSNDLPDGKGSITLLSGYGQDKISRRVTVGSFSKGLENGDMVISKIEDGTDWGKMQYSASAGVPAAFKNNGKEVTNQEGKKVMGYYYLNDKVTHVASFDDGAVFAVNGLGLN